MVNSSNNSQQLKKVFLECYPEGFTITQTSKMAGVNRGAFYYWMEHDPQFVKDFEIAKQSAIDMLETEARRRAMKCSDTLLIFLLKGAAPDKYKDRVEQKIHAEVNVKTDPTELTDAELQDIALRGRTGTIKAPVGSQSSN